MQRFEIDWYMSLYDHDCDAEKGRTAKRAYVHLYTYKNRHVVPHSPLPGAWQLRLYRHQVSPGTLTNMLSAHGWFPCETGHCVEASRWRYPSGGVIALASPGFHWPRLFVHSENLEFWISTGTKTLENSGLSGPPSGLCAVAATAFQGITCCVDWASQSAECCK